MSTVEGRTVTLNFDNGNFERKVASTIQTLDNLNKGLELQRGSEGLSRVAEAANRLTLEPIVNAVSGVSGKFVAMASVAVTAISNIVNRAVDAGISITKAFTIDPIKDGLQEYELNMGSIQTILSNTKSKGSTLDDVNKSLSELNEYSDKTIYNFGQMARNIGTFTAAGVGLDTSTKAIKGISNLAAISGSSAEQASSAMYQLSQALSSGKVQLIDWVSVVNSGMGGEVFQKALFETGKAMHTIEGVTMDTTFEEWTKSAGAFRDTLKDDWLTADVLTNTLAGFTGDLDEAQILAMGYTKEQAKAIMEMGVLGNESATKIKTISQLMSTLKESAGSGWSESFKIIIGDFEQARTVLTTVGGFLGGIIGRSADARNSILKDWAALGGRDKMLEGIYHVFALIGSIITPIKDAFHDIFPKTTGQTLMNITTSAVEFLAAIRPVSDVTARMRDIFAGMFGIMNAGITVIKEIALTLWSAAQNFIPLADRMLSFFGAIGTAVKTVVSRGTGGGISAWFENLRVSIDKFIDSKLGSYLAKAVKWFEDATAAIQKWTAEGASLDKVSKVFNKFGSMFDGFASAPDSAGEALERFKNKVGQISDKIKEFGNTIGEHIGNLWSRIGEVFDGNVDVSKVFDGLNVGLFAALTLLFRKFVNEGISLDFAGGFLDNVKSALEGLTDTMGAMQAKLKSEALLSIAKAIAVLTVSVVILSLIDARALTRALSAMAVGFGEMATTLKTLTMISSTGKLPVLVGSMIALAAAMAILAIAVKMIAKLEWSELGRGLAGIAALLTMVTIAVKGLSTMSGSLSRSGVALIGLSVSMLIMTEAVKHMSELNWTELSKGLLGTSIALAGVTIAVRAMPKDMMDKGLGMIAISGALYILGSAISTMGATDSGEMVQGLTGLGLALGGITLAVKVLAKSNNLLSVGASLVLVAAGVQIMALAIGFLGNMDAGSLERGLLSLAAGMVILAAASKAMTNALPGAAAILVMSAALFVLADVMNELGKMSLSEVGIALLAIAGVLLIFGVAASVLSTTAPALYALAGGLLALGATFTLFGVGAYLIAESLRTLGELGTNALNVLGGAIDVIVSKIPAFVSAVVSSLIGGIVQLGEHSEELITAVVSLLGTIIDGLIVLVPKVGELIVALIDAILPVITDKVPDLIAAGWKILTELLNGIENNIGDIVESVSNIIIKFTTGLSEKAEDLITAGSKLLTAILDGIEANISDVTTSAANVVIAFLQSIAAQIPGVITAGVDIIVAILNGIANNMGRIVTAGANIIIEFLKGIGRESQRVIQAGWDLIIGFINGLADSVEKNMPELRKAAVRLAGAVVDGFTGGLADKARDLVSRTIAPFRDAVNGIKNFLGIHSPSKVAAEIGGFFGQGFILGIDGETSKVVKSATRMGRDGVSALNNTLNAIGSSFSTDLNLTPTIAPVLDLTGVRKSAQGIDNMLSSSMGTASAVYAATIYDSTERPVTQEPTKADVNTTTEVTFIQNNYSPEALSAADIHTATRSQLALARERLGI